MNFEAADVVRTGTVHGVSINREKIDFYVSLPAGDRGRLDRFTFDQDVSATLHAPICGGTGGRGKGDRSCVRSPFLH